MYRDMVLDEARRMALITAKLLDINAVDNGEEFEQEFNKVLENEYNIDLKELLSLNEANFNTLIKSNIYGAEKLNALSQSYICLPGLSDGMTKPNCF
jgi:hypothetical protein